MPTYLLIPHKNLEVKLKMFEGLEAYMVSAPFFFASDNDSDNDVD